MISEEFGRFKTFCAFIVGTLERFLCFMDVVMLMKILFCSCSIVTLVTPEANFCCLMKTEDVALQVHGQLGCKVTMRTFVVFDTCVMLRRYMIPEGMSIHSGVLTVDTFIWIIIVVNTHVVTISERESS